jgi:FlaG/FlaF family flagellin (archaellin)
MFKDTAGDDRASASTIGIILLVAITVILGATIAGYMLDLRSSVEGGGPDASFQFEYNSVTGDVQVTHESGDPVNGSQLRFAGAANEYNQFGSISGWSGGQVEAGDTVSVAVDEGETIELIWRNLEGDKTIVLNTYEVPSVGPAAQGDLGVSADLANDEVEVSVNSLADASNGQAYLKTEVEGDGTVDTQTVSSTGTVTISHDLDQGENVNVTLYESSSESNVLAEASDTTPSVTITEIDATATNGGGNADVIISVEGSNIENNAVSVLLVDDPADPPGDEADRTDTISDLDQGEQSTTITVDGSNIEDSEDLTVTVYETGGQNYELANESTTGGDTYTAP